MHIISSDIGLILGLYLGVDRMNRFIYTKRHNNEHSATKSARYHEFEVIISHL